MLEGSVLVGSDGVVVVLEEVEPGPDGLEAGPVPPLVPVAGLHAAVVVVEPDPAPELILELSEPLELAVVVPAPEPAFWSVAWPLPFPAVEELDELSTVGSVTTCVRPDVLVFFAEAVVETSLAGCCPVEDCAVVEAVPAWLVAFA